MDVLKRVNRELNQEMRKQVDLIYSAAAIALPGTGIKDGGQNGSEGFLIKRLRRGMNVEPQTRSV